MSGSINYGALFNNTVGDAGNLLDIIYGNNALSGANPLQALSLAEKNQTQDIAITAQEPQVQRDIAAFKTASATATDATSLLSNPSVMKVLLTANGLADQIPYTALAQKTLLSNVKDPSALVNQLTDIRWKPVVQTFDFANKGLTIFQQPKVLSTIENAYAEVVWRQSLDATTPGLSNALTFRTKAGGITSVDQILGDPTLRTVVTTALGIPEQIAFQELPAQEQAISSRLDITKFKDPKFVEGFAQQYLLAAQTTVASGSTDLLSLAVQATGLVV